MFPMDGPFGLGSRGRRFAASSGTGDQTIPNVAYKQSYLVAWKDTGTDLAAYTPNLSPGPKNGWGVGFERFPRFSSYSEVRTIAPK